MKKIIYLSTISTTIILAGCSSSPIESYIQTDTTVSLGQKYTIGSQQTIQENIYGTVIGDNSKNITSSVGGILNTINCQPGSAVTANTIIAKIEPNLTDPNIQNTIIQQNTLQQQINNLQNMYTMTANNFDIQMNIIKKQNNNSEDLLQNLEAQRRYTSDDYTIQGKSFDNQIDALQDAQDADLNKIDNNIRNFREQQYIALEDTFNTIENLGVNGESNRYNTLHNKLNGNMSDKEFSRYLGDVGDMLFDIASSISNTTAYKTLISAANAVWASKTSFDNLLPTYSTVSNNYDNQINTLKLNAENTQDNRSQLADIQIDNQIKNMTLSISLFDDQLKNLENNKNIQLTTIENQLIGLKQNYASITNTLQGETIYAGVDGVIKSKAVGSDNKVGPNTLLCQIIPNNQNNKKIQLFSAKPIDKDQDIILFDNDIVLGKIRITYILPYKDPTTQNYIYEIDNIRIPVTEGDRITASFTKSFNTNEVWVPINYVFAKLDGNYLRVVGSSTGFVETKVLLGDINDTMVRVMSGVTNGQTIIN